MKLNKLIEETRSDIKAKVKILLQESPDISDMDPYVVKLLLTESKPRQQKNKDEEEDDDEEDQDSLL